MDAHYQYLDHKTWSGEPLKGNWGPMSRTWLGFFLRFFDLGRSIANRFLWAPKCNWDSVRHFFVKPVSKRTDYLPRVNVKHRIKTSATTSRRMTQYFSDCRSRCGVGHEPGSSRAAKTEDEHSKAASEYKYLISCKTSCLNPVNA